MCKKLQLHEINFLNTLAENENTLNLDIENNKIVLENWPQKETLKDLEYLEKQYDLDITIINS